MKLTREQKEAKLREAADEMIQALLGWDEENGAPKLTEMEDEILELRRQMGGEDAGRDAGRARGGTAGRNTEMCAVWRGDAQQGTKGESGGKSCGWSQDGTRPLLLCPLQERDFSPWTSNLSWEKGHGVKA